MSRIGYGHMVQEYYVDRVREVRRERRARLDGLKTHRQALAYRDHVREAIAKAFGPRPPRPDLRTTVTGEVEQRGYRIEKLSYESRPGCLVTANLYVPNKVDGLAPAVVGSCGHDAAGKQAPIYQAFCQRLARSGFITLILDPFNQGERDQYYSLKDRKIVQSCTHAHNMMGKQLQVLGDWFGAWRGWDCIRALDLLLARPDIDPNRIGITGNSGGGTMTTWVWGVDDRFAFAAPSCFVTTFQHNLENELPADAEQYPPGVIGRGLELADFLIAQAPKPVTLLGQKFDFFDRRGVKEAYEDVRHFYRVLGASTRNVAWFIGPQGHGFSDHNQNAMLAFFCRHAKMKPTKAKPTLLDAKTLNVTPQGEVIPAGAVPIFKMSGRHAESLKASRKRLSRDALKRSLRSVLVLPPRKGVPHYRCLRGATEAVGRVARYAIETEPGIRAILRKVMDTPHTHTLDVEREIHLYLPHLASDEELDQAIVRLTREDVLAGRIRGNGSINLTRPSKGLYALDVRGLGESRPDDRRPFFHSYGADYMHDGYAILLGESFVGRRVFDVLRTMDLLHTEGTQRIHLSGQGQGAILALFAGLLHERTGRITLRNGPLSYHEWTQVPLVHWPSSCVPRGVLKRFDLPDCIRALGKRVSLVQPWRPDMKPYTKKQLAAALKDTGISPSTLAPTGGARIVHR